MENGEFSWKILQGNGDSTSDTEWLGHIDAMMPASSNLWVGICNAWKFMQAVVDNGEEWLIANNSGKPTNTDSIHHFC